MSVFYFVLLVATLELGTIGILCSTIIVIDAFKKGLWRGALAVVSPMLPWTSFMKPVPIALLVFLVCAFGASYTLLHFEHERKMWIVLLALLGIGLLWFASIVFMLIAAGS